MCAHLATLESAVRGMSMSVCLTLVIQEAHTIAYNSPTAIVVNVARDTQVSDATKYLMDVKEGPAGMEAAVLLPVTLRTVLSANAHLALRDHLVSMIHALVGA